MESNCDITAGGRKSDGCPLIRRCVVGDEEAWETVVRSVVRRIFWLGYRATRCREDAEDLTQEILLRVYSNLHQFRQDAGSLQAWILAVARNLIIDHYRQIRHLPDKTGTDEMEQLNLAEERLTDPLHAAEQAEASEFVRYGLRRLPPHLRQAIKLKDIEELEYREIATRLRVAEGTIKSRVSRGRVQLARIMSARLRKQLRRSSGGVPVRTRPDAKLRPSFVLMKGQPHGIQCAVALRKRGAAHAAHLGIGVRTIMTHSRSGLEVSPA